jgi:regulator of protease activity HflC (stomatin/prohibitin superfamily)
MRATLDQATDPWGIKVGRVELKNIILPDDIKNSMERQMKAERERRAVILAAEGEKKSAVLRAEGKKESAVLEAEAEKEAAILRADAAKEKMIREAQGRAESIRTTQEATADGIRMIKEAGADQAVLALKSLEVWPSVANGRATKIIIPSEIQNIAGLVKSIQEVASDAGTDAGRDESDTVSVE